MLITIDTNKLLLKAGEIASSAVTPEEEEWASALEAVALYLERKEAE